MCVSGLSGRLGGGYEGRGECAGGGQAGSSRELAEEGGAEHAGRAERVEEVCVITPLPVTCAVSEEGMGVVVVVRRAIVL